MKQITAMWEVIDGKRYFIMQTERSGLLRTGIVTAHVTTKGKPIVNSMTVEFAMDEKNSDLTPGFLYEDSTRYIAELDE